MTNEIDQTIRSLKVSLRELNTITLNDYYVNVKSTPINQMWFSEHINDSKYHLKILIADLEEKYQKLHKPGAYND